MANLVALLFVISLAAILALALLWRVGSWNLHPADVLTHDEGLRVGTLAPQVAAHRGKDEYHLDFVSRTTLVVFGLKGCRPCQQLLEAAPRHPATRHARLVYISNDDPADLDADHGSHWEIYRFHDQAKAREMWRAPVSPYFHLVNSQGVIVAKGVANAPEHLDRLLHIGPLDNSVNQVHVSSLPHILERS